MNNKRALAIIFVVFFALMTILSDCAYVQAAKDNLQKTEVVEETDSLDEIVFEEEERISAFDDCQRIESINHNNDIELPASDEYSEENRHSLLGTNSFTPRYSPYDTNMIYYSDSLADERFGSRFRLPNCTTYAYGRVYEIKGEFPGDTICCEDAEKWFDYNKDGGFYQYSTDPSEPRVGAIVCYRTDASGHVQIVEEIDTDENGKYIVVSESNYTGRQYPKKAFNVVKIYLEDLDGYFTEKGYHAIRIRFLEDNDGWEDDQNADGNYAMYATFQGYIYTYDEEVGEKVSEVNIEEGDVSIFKNSNFLLHASVLPDDATNKTINWSSSDESIVTVDENGVLSGVGVGEATITATAADGSGASDSIKVTVIDTNSGDKIYATGIQLNKGNICLQIGDETSISASVSPENASNKTVKWTSSNRKVATVDSEGKISALSEGTSVITARTSDGSNLTASIEVEVLEKVTPVSSITLNKNNIGMSVNSTYKLVAKVLPKDASNKTLRWTSSEPDVASVENGIVKAKTEGETDITVMASDGSNAEENCHVRVFGTGSEYFSEIGADDITSYNVKLYAVLSEALSADMYGVYVASDENLEDFTKIKINSLDAIDSIRVNLSNYYSLIENTDYYYRFFVVLDGEEYTSGVGIFTTGKSEDDPSIVIDKQYSRGDIVNFGHRYWGSSGADSEIEAELRGKSAGYYTINGKVYYTNGDNAVWQTIPIRWIVLEDEGDTVLLTPEFVLEGYSYASDVMAGEVTWATSDIRKYINSAKFLRRYFVPAEQNLIQKSLVASEGIITEDKVFLPSIDEMAEYYSDARYRKAKYYSKYTPDVTTPITGLSDELAYDRKNYTCAFWTRSSNQKNYGWSQPSYVDCNGTIRSGGRVYYTWSSGVRPMIRVEKNDELITRAITDISNPFSESVYLAEEGTYHFDFYEDYLNLPYPIYISITNSLGGGGSSTTYGVIESANLILGKHPIDIYISGITSTDIKYSATIMSVPKKEQISISNYADENGCSVKLKWQRSDAVDDSKGKRGYEIQRSLDGGVTYETVYIGTLDWEDDDKSNSLVYTYLDSDVSTGKEYCYRIRGLYYSSGGTNLTNIDGYYGEFSNEVSILVSDVGEEPENLSLSVGSLLMRVGDTYKMDCILRSMRYSESDLLFSAENEDIVKLEGDGIITAISAGSTNVYVSTPDRKMEARCYVRVVKPDEDENVEEKNEVEEGDLKTGEEIPVGLWVATSANPNNEDGDYVYTGKAIKPDVRVYDGKKRLVLNKDYTVKYSNNTKAYTLSEGDEGFYNSKGKTIAPTITVTGKGNYNGKETAYFKIIPIDISTQNAGVFCDDFSVSYTKKAQKPVPVLNSNGKNLKNKTDYSIEYYLKENYISADSPGTKLDAVKEAGEYVVRLTGKGNYSGVREVNLRVVQDTSVTKLVSKLSFSRIPNQSYNNGEAVTPSVVVKDKGSTLVSVMENADEYDYLISYENNIGVGTGYVVITGNEARGYSGTKRISFKITGISLKNATATGIPATVEYTGTDVRFDDEIKSGDIYLKQKKTDSLLVPYDAITGKGDYTVSYKNNTKAGKATITFTGTNGYTGSLSKTYKITPYSLNGDLVEVDCDFFVKYEKGGAKANICITNLKTGEELTRDVDYTVSYSDNKYSHGFAYANVKGKGNYKDTYTKGSLAFLVQTQDIGNLSISAKDIKYQKKANKFITSFTVLDVNGKALKSGTDYYPSVHYSYVNATNVTQLKNNRSVIVYRSAGDGVEKEDIIPAGTIIQIHISGKGNYDGDCYGTYRVIQNPISSAKVIIPKQVYTGNRVTLNEEDITVKISGKEVPAVDPVTGKTNWMIDKMSYKNNINKGKASVTIKGVGNYGGSKTQTFTITSKGIHWFWRT